MIERGKEVLLGSCPPLYVDMIRVYPECENYLENGTNGFGDKLSGNRVANLLVFIPGKYEKPFCPFICYTNFCIVLG